MTYPCTNVHVPQSSLNAEHCTSYQAHVSILLDHGGAHRRERRQQQRHAARQRRILGRALLLISRRRAAACLALQRPVRP
eukprot:357293-Chlamydomonas_euryale.AAC.6